MFYQDLSSLNKPKDDDDNSNFNNNIDFLLNLLENLLVNNHV